MIRPGTPADLQNVAALQIASWRDAYADSLPAEYLGQPVVDDLTTRWSSVDLTTGDILLVSEGPNGIQGFIMVLMKDTPYVDNLHVDPKLRRSGIGKALLKAAASALIEKGETGVYLTVLTDNDRAIKFYTSMGAEVGPEQTDMMFDQKVKAFPMTWNDLPALAAI
ncbi:MAG: GNAT family N-acetyltransferase [Marinosulfonomonas sp.]